MKVFFFPRSEADKIVLQQMAVNQKVVVQQGLGGFYWDEEIERKPPTRLKIRFAGKPKLKPKPLPKTKPRSKPKQTPKSPAHMVAILATRTAPATTVQEQFFDRSDHTFESLVYAFDGQGLEHIDPWKTPGPGEYAIVAGMDYRVRWREA